MTYDEWKLETPEDEAYRKAGRGPRRGVYRVTVTRTLEMSTVVEVEASCEADALDDALCGVAHLSADKWEITQDDYDTADIEGPPERDPNDARDDRMDRR